MIKLTATALVHYISPVNQVSANFSKRELILNDSWEKNGETHPNFVSIEFSGDAMAQLDAFYPGQRVTVEAYVNGREWNGKIINSIRGRSVTPVQTQPYAQPQAQAIPAQYQQPYQQAAPQPAAMPGYATPAPQPTYPQQVYASAPQPAQAYQQLQSPGVADLPFPT
ncbi:MAG: DUF3127 domain-containing protein [Candidatus Amulumruptor caecigallinarius]|nr:DUF3127 domain-containing protein [Candidatus Amulumruptor caecigallinarius]MCM1397428.1 DUF3127 domain-containing protein [Candidatus Amulumruptor caecigallinarius]MCM1454365.1 DUF3127 domain-containing protein [bacterium]